jgi:hypothetical protein
MKAMIGNPAVIQTYTQITDTLANSLNIPDFCGPRVYSFINSQLFVTLKEPTNPWMGENYQI